MGKRLVPTIIEATVIPTSLFYTALLLTGHLAAGLLTILGWTYVAVGRRLVSRRRVPAILILTSLGISVRTLVFIMSGSTFVYFAQPIAGTLVTAAFFGTSALIGRPLIARFADDFCPLTPDVRDRPAISRLFRRLTFLWAGINLTSALLSAVLLLTLPTRVFVGSRTLAVWGLTFAGVILTVSASVRVAREENLATAVGPNGLLRAYVGAPTIV